MRFNVIGGGKHIHPCVLDMQALSYFFSLYVYHGIYVMLIFEIPEKKNIIYSSNGAMRSTSSINSLVD